MQELTIGNRGVSNDSKTLIIAEAGINHDGKFEQALQLIDIAAESGADIVKFQLFKAKKMITSRFGEFKNAAGKTMSMQRVLEEVELPEFWIPKLMEHCSKRNIGFLCTVCDENGVDILSGYGVDSFKIASSELSHLPLLKYAASFNKTLIVSEAGAYLSDVDIALRAIQEMGNDKIALLHCIYKYPTPLEECNLNIIPMYKKAFPDLVIGYSDHTLDPIKAPVTAVILGAKIIEKHFTLDKCLPGADHSYALEPVELKLMCDAIRKVEALSDTEKQQYVCEEAIGSSKKTLNDIERLTRKGSYRCLMTTATVKKGEPISSDNMAVLRPGVEERGLDSYMYDILINNNAKYTRDIDEGKAILWQDVLTSL